MDEVERGTFHAHQAQLDGKFLLQEIGEDVEEIPRGGYGAREGFGAGEDLEGGFLQLEGDRLGAEILGGQVARHLGAELGEHGHPVSYTHLTLPTIA